MDGLLMPATFVAPSTSAAIAPAAPTPAPATTGAVLSVFW
jgi:hypothetical protein